ncbi:dihydrofolate reductase [Psychromicrobium silvestre]|uniref:Dihydrofolate reductase n=1 Tax=Psychromicrobium silvestre TaxID=1645614 RepID=A0A7Y9LVL6_9MICC|nr:dihydrofolate reductase family protein [Psychromicrobium silvestre]NYE96404.1 dihydrofolate reductase [Psychromicrobium silvestre]
MRTLSVVNNISLDGVTQAPGSPDEDTRNGFRYGGWSAAYNDEILSRTMSKGMAGEGAMLFGRRTYQNFASYWPFQGDNPFTVYMNRVQKFVASNGLNEPLPWANSVLLSGDTLQAIAELKASEGPDLTVIGSGELVRSLLAARLVDKLTLVIHPLLLGNGHRLFDERPERQNFRLVESTPTSTGVIIGEYELVLQE